jgi:hypothetical protein
MCCSDATPLLREAVAPGSFKLLKELLVWSAAVSISAEIARGPKVGERDMHGGGSGCQANRNKEHRESVCPRWWVQHVLLLGRVDPGEEGVDTRTWIPLQGLGQLQDVLCNDALMGHPLHQRLLALDLQIDRPYDKVRGQVVAHQIPTHMATAQKRVQHDE